MDEEKLNQEQGELTLESTPEDLKRYLVKEAELVLQLVAFETRNHRMAEVVGRETSLLASKSIGQLEIADKLVGVFTGASEAAGNKFKEAFNK